MGNSIYSKIILYNKNVAIFLATCLEKVMIVTSIHGLNYAMLGTLNWADRAWNVIKMSLDV